MAKDQNIHDVNIVNQFTKQAIPFTKLPEHLDSIKVLIEMSGVTGKDIVLDVACGPGLVSCEFAKIANHVTGIDLTEKMIEQAKERQRELNLKNLSWTTGTVLSLPYRDCSFSMVISRYSFHHFLDPDSVLKEMIRVCKKSGTILIADVSLPENNLDAYNRMEKLRDPSHTSALSFEQWENTLKKAGLINLKRTNYTVEMELEKLLNASFPNPGSVEIIRNIFNEDLKNNSSGVNTRLVNDSIYFSYPISVYVGNK